MNNNKIPRFYTTREVAHMFCVDITTIERAARRGDIAAAKIGRQWRFSQDAIKSLEYKRNPKKQ